MSELRMCRICLRQHKKMYRMRFGSRRTYRPNKEPTFDPISENAKLSHIKYFSDVMGISLNENEVPAPLFCKECVTILHEFQKFREKCYMGQNQIKVMLFYYLYSEDNMESNIEEEIHPIDHLLPLAADPID